MLGTFVKRLFLPAFFAVFFCLLISQVTLSIGDTLLRSDTLAYNKTYSLAKTFYTVSKLTNPFNFSIERRLLATNVLLDDYTGNSEETNDPKILANLTQGSFVLGTSTQVPVLMYHYIRVNPDPNDKVGFNLSVTPWDFSAQLDWLAQHGYHSITLDDLGANLFYHIKLPPKPVVLTFDDGYRDFYTD